VFVFQGAACLGVVIFFFLFFSFRIPSWYDEVGEFCIYPATLGQAGRCVPWVLWSYTREMCWDVIASGSKVDMFFFFFLSQLRAEIAVMSPPLSQRGNFNDLVYFSCA